MKNTNHETKIKETVAGAANNTITALIEDNSEDGESCYQFDDEEELKHFLSCHNGYKLIQIIPDPVFFTVPEW